MEIEELAQRLTHLADKPVLTKVEHTEARELMCQLKAAGMSNQEISKLSKGKWSESTVKGYTKGIKAVDSASWQDAIGMFDELVSNGITLDDVSATLEVHEHLKQSKISITDIAQVISETQSASVTLSELVHYVEELKKSDLSTNDTAEALTFKKQLEDHGMTLNSLPLLSNAITTHGDGDRLLEAVTAYGSLDEIKHDITAAHAQLTALNKEYSNIKKDLRNSKNELLRNKKQLEAYHKVSRFGIGEKELLRIAEIVQKHGGAQSALKVINAFADYAEIEGKIVKAESELEKCQKNIDILDIKYNHIKASVAMCDQLIYSYNFGPDAIAMILSVAKKFGDSFEALNALEAYGSLKDVKQEYEIVNGQLNEKRKQLNDLEGRNKAELEQMESLHTRTVKIATEVTRLEARFNQSTQSQQLLTLLTEPEKTGYKETALFVGAIAASLIKWLRVHMEGDWTIKHSAIEGLEYLVKKLGLT